MFNTLILTIALALDTTLAQARTWKYGGKMGGGAATIHFWGTLTDPSTGLQRYIWVNLVPDIVAIDSVTPDQTFYLVDLGLCTGTNDTAQSCVRVGGLIPVPTKAITQTSQESITVDLDIPLLVSSTVVAWCTVMNPPATCPGSVPVPTTFPLRGTFASVPVGTAGAFRNFGTGTRGYIDFGIGGSREFTLNGTYRATKALFTGIIGDVIVRPEGLAEGTCDLEFNRGVASFTYTEDRPQN